MIICMYIYIYIYIYTHVYIYIHTYTRRPVGSEGAVRQTPAPAIMSNEFI